MRANRRFPVCLFAAALALAAGSGRTAFAAPYPVSGKWTYENASGEGPAKDCGKRFMEFAGERRFDKGGGVPQYRNFTVDRTGNSEYRIVDQFSTGQINARSSYTLRKIDADHIELRLDAGGKTIALRRCQ